MYYVIFTQDKPNTLPSVSAYARNTQHACNNYKMKIGLLTAGPNPAIDDENPGDAGFTGSTVIAQFDSLEEAKNLGKPGSLC